MDSAPSGSEATRGFSATLKDVSAAYKLFFYFVLNKDLTQIKPEPLNQISYIKIANLYLKTFWFEEPANWFLTTAQE